MQDYLFVYHLIYGEMLVKRPSMYLGEAEEEQLFVPGYEILGHIYAPISGTFISQPQSCHKIFPFLT